MILKDIFKDKKLVVFEIIALVGVIIMLFSGCAIKSDEKYNGEKETILDPDEYSRRLENEVISLCKSVAGDCQVTAVVSLSGGYRSVYVSDMQSATGGGYKNSTVLVGSGSSEGAILERYENPEISGIGIVISSEYNEYVETSVISLVSAAFDVRKNKIHVAFGK